MKLLQLLRFLEPEKSDIDEGLDAYISKVNPYRMDLQEEIFRLSDGYSNDIPLALIGVKRLINESEDNENPSDVEIYYANLLDSVFRRLREYCEDCDLEV